MNTNAYSHSYRMIIYLALLAIGLNVFRLTLAENTSYIWLNWNLVLAVAPVIFAYLALKIPHKVLAVICTLLWIGFLPNAPYLITDFIHLADVGPRALVWYDGMMIFVYSLVGVLAYLVSLFLIKKRFQFGSWFLLVIALATGYGIYLGRYHRFNTWDVVTNPVDITVQIGEILTQPSVHEPMMLMTFIFALVLAVISYFVQPIFHHEKTND